MQINWHEKAWDDYTLWEKSGVKKINSLIKTISRGNRAGKAELLRGNLSGWSSSRIDEANRLIYRVRGDVLEILSCRGHYSQE